MRMAENKDIIGVIKLLKQVAYLHHIGRPDLFKKNSSKYNEKQLEDIFKDKNKPVFVAIDDNENIIGYAFCIFQRYSNNNILTDIKTLYIDDLCVDENFRGKHIGQKIYEAIVSFAKLNDCYNITLNVWNCNEAAKRFYEKLGLLPQKIGLEMILEK